MSTSTLDDVLILARQLTPADQAQLVAHLTPGIASALNRQERTTAASAFPPDSLAARLAADPNSSLARVLRIMRSESPPPTDDDIEKWREERLSERYNV